MIIQARESKSRTLGLFGPASIVTGVSSFTFHASYTYVFQVFDYFGMFCFVYLAMVVNLRRGGYINKSYQLPIYSSLVVCTTAIVPIVYHYKLFPYQLIMVALVLGTILQEAHLSFMASVKSMRRWSDDGSGTIQQKRTPR